MYEYIIASDEGAGKGAEQDSEDEEDESQDQDEECKYMPLLTRSCTNTVSPYQ